MSTGDDRVGSHRATQLVRELAERVESLPAPTDVSDLEIVERLRAISRRLNYLVDNADATLVTSSMLDNLASGLSNLNAQLEAFATSANTQQLSNANQYADQALDAAAVWPLPSEANIQGLRDSATSFRKSATQLIRTLGDEIGEAQKTVEERQSAFELQLAQTEGRVQTIQTQAEALESRSATVVSDLQNQFLQSQTEMKSEFADQISTQAQAFDDAVQQINTKADDALAALERKVEESVHDIEQKRDEAATLLNVIGRIGTTFGYTEFREEQKAQADFWRKVAIGTLVAIATLGLGALLLSVVFELDTGAVATKVVVAVALGGLATYAGRESAQHRSLEREARKYELETAALDPYIALLDPAEQQAIKGEMARKLFGNVYSEKAKDAPSSTSLLAEAVKSLADLVKREQG